MEPPPPAPFLWVCFVVPRTSFQQNTSEGHPKSPPPQFLPVSRPQEASAASPKRSPPRVRRPDPPVCPLVGGLPPGFFCHPSQKIQKKRSLPNDSGALRLWKVFLPRTWGALVVFAQPDHALELGDQWGKPKRTAWGCHLQLGSRADGWQIMAAPSCQCLPKCPTWFDMWVCLQVRTHCLDGCKGKPTGNQAFQGCLTLRHQGCPPKGPPIKIHAEVLEPEPQMGVPQSGGPPFGWYLS